MSKFRKSRFNAKRQVPKSYLPEESWTWTRVFKLSHMTGIQHDTVSPSDLRVYEQHYSSVSWPWQRPDSPLGWWLLEDLAQEVLVTQVCESCCGWCDVTRHALTLKMSWSPFDSRPIVTEPIFPTQSRPETVGPVNRHDPDWIRLKGPATLLLPAWGHVVLTTGFGMCFSAFVCVCFSCETLLLLPQMDEAEDCCQLPQPGSHGNWKMRSLTRVTLSALGAAIFLVLCKAASGKVHLQMYRSVCWTVGRLCQSVS